ncbi:stage V sporulation protein B [Paenibacillus spongiae]|uniref:Stage V sporulation protein B n=1 Tax=Paenibacillus spongiae TaxID=2909671 RepID=A0ABY5SGH5_9BACL|nr:stage V sporulation protein B [Paenibacillus spongiae]UVI33046.1 stage V sporulation protein B [Paenibacillus spongiae]
MQRQSFIRGTFILTGAAFISRILGFINGIILARMLGTEGIGLLMMAQPLIPLVITLTCLGLPVAISKLVAEAEAQGHPHKVKRILVVSLTVTASLSLLLTLLTFIGAKLISHHLLTDQRAYYAMLAITPIAPIVAVSSVLKGYFRGRLNMKPLAYSQVIEQLLRIGFIIGLVHLLLPYGIEYAAAGAMVSSVIGEGFALLYLISMFKLSRVKKPSGDRLLTHLHQGRRTFLDLLRIGLPTTGNGIIDSIYRAFQPILITKSLIISGSSAVMATKTYGLLAGYTFPLLFLPSFITQSISTALLPAISEAKAQNNRLLIHHRVEQALRISLLVGAPSTVILFVWADPLTTMLYQAPEAGKLLRLIAPIFILHYFEGPLHAVLLGIGKAKTTMVNFILSTLIKIGCIVLFGTKLGIVGVIMGINIGISLLTLFNFYSVSRSIGLSIEIRMIMKVALCSLLMAVSGHYAWLYLHGYAAIPYLFAIAGSIALSLLVYLAGLLWTDAMNKDDFGKVPILRRIYPKRS